MSSPQQSPEDQPVEAPWFTFAKGAAIVFLATIVIAVVAITLTSGDNTGTTTAGSGSGSAAEAPATTVAEDTGGGASETPEAPAAPTADMALGQTVFEANCAVCHGQNGEGLVGPQLGGGAAVANFPDPADQIAVVTDGRGGMPAWGSSLSEEEIAAVVAYEREGLSG